MIPSSLGRSRRVRVAHRDTQVSEEPLALFVGEDYEFLYIGIRFTPDQLIELNRGEINVERRVEHEHVLPSLGMSVSCCSEAPDTSRLRLVSELAEDLDE